jgi:hypothetical protein
LLPPDSPTGPGGVACSWSISDEPEVKRAMSFIDGQNLFRHAELFPARLFPARLFSGRLFRRAKDAFGHYPKLRLTEVERRGVRRASLGRSRHTLSYGRSEV